MVKTVPLLLALLVTLVSCGGKSPQESRRDAPTGPFTLTCPAAPAGELPPLHTSCQDNPGVSPPLAWTNAPSATKSFTLRAVNQDKSGRLVWYVLGIPGTAHTLPANLGDMGLQDDGTVQAMTWAAPCPASRGATEHVRFILYALDAFISPDAPDLTGAMEGHILQQTEITLTVKGR